MTDERPACCVASRENARPARDPDTSPTGRDRADESLIEPAADGDPRTSGMEKIEGQTFTMGTDDEVGFPADGEGPAREVTVDAFWIDRYPMTNAHFKKFVQDTDYTTDAERYGWSFVFEDFVAEADASHVLDQVAAAPWWVAVEGASWFRPEGPSSSLYDEDRWRHPVIHISWRDAQAYAEWAGKRLPTEAEWECAGRGGLSGARYPWGDELRPNDEHRCNIWQGQFPEHNTAEDGYVGTAPVTAFEPNGYGLYSVAGNVWEWCNDWFSPDYHTTDAYSSVNPTGPPDGIERVMRGGSYLCHRSWCNRYRMAARSKTSPDTSTGNVGFRCVVDAD